MTTYNLHPMGLRTRAITATSLAWALVFSLAICRPAQATGSNFSVYYTFTGGKGGEFPEAGLTVDTSTGRLYGTTFGALGNGMPGKNCGKSCGTADSFRNGKLKSFYAFQAGEDGAFPTGEVAINSGTVYGTTEYGGGTDCNGLGCGTVFSIQGSTEKIFTFCRSGEFPMCPNGALPHAGPIIGTDQNLYGTTTLGGSGTGYACDNNFGGCGTVYKLLTSDLKTVSVLHSFCVEQNCQDGAIPYGKLVQDPSSGNLYGTTQFGGMYGQGTIFELQLSGTYNVLYSFCKQHNCQDGAVPEAGLIEDGAGNLYGTASAGGEPGCEGSSPGCGVIFELPAAGPYEVLYAFEGGTDGELPQAPLVLDKAGNLYGTTEKGGEGPYCSNPTVGCGTVFMLPPGGTEMQLYVFGKINPRTDGAQPEGALLLQKGSLYGATRVAGDVGGSTPCKCGTLFKIAVGGGTPKKALRADYRAVMALRRSSGVAIVDSGSRLAPVPRISTVP